MENTQNSDDQNVLVQGNAWRKLALSEKKKGEIENNKYGRL